VIKKSDEKEVLESISAKTDIQAQMSKVEDQNDHNSKARSTNSRIETGYGV